MKWIRNKDTELEEYIAKGYRGIGKNRILVDNAYIISINEMSGCFGKYHVVRCDVPFDNKIKARKFIKKLQGLIKSETNIS